MQVTQSLPHIKENLFVEKEQHHAATIIQSVWKRYSVQSRVLLPEELRPFLKQGLPHMNHDEVEATALIISRESIAMFNSPTSYQDQGVRLAKLKTKCLDENQKEHQLPQTIWLQLSKNTKTLRMQFYGKLFRTGTYKGVHESETLVINLCHGRRKPKHVEHTLFVRTGDSIKPSDRKKANQKQIRERIDKDLAEVRSGIETIQRIFTTEELANPKLKLAGIPNTIRIHEGKTRKKLEWEVPRFPADLNDVYQTGLIPLDISGNETVKFRTNDKFRMAESLFFNVTQIHHKGKVLRDVKPANVLIRFNPDKQHAEAFNIDYDLLSNFGSDSLHTDYCYWDICSEQGFVLPTTDIYGVAMCLARSLFGKLYPERLGKVRHKVFSEQIIESIFEFHGRLIARKLTPILKSTRDLPLQRDKLRTFLQQVSYEAILERVRVPDISRIKDALDAIVKANPEKEQAVKELIADNYAARNLGLLLREIHEADMNLSIFISRTKEGWNMANLLNDDETPLEVKLAVIQELYKTFSIFKNFGSRVKSIRKGWENLSR